MLTSTEAVVVSASVAGAFQAFVSIRLLFSHAYTGRQKLWQFLLVWFIPILGAVFVYIFMQSDSTHSPRAETNFTPDGGGNPPGIGS
jgi:hypothetical protein